MKIVSFNINSIRARPHQLIHLRDTINPDVIGIQETKVNQAGLERIRNGKYTIFLSETTK